MGAQMLAPHGENQARLGAIGDGDQHCRLDLRSRAEFGEIAFEWRLKRRGRQCCAQTFGEGHTLSNGKKAPLLHTPGGLQPAASASSASS